MPTAYRQLAELHKIATSIHGALLRCHGQAVDSVNRCRRVKAEDGVDLALMRAAINGLSDAAEDVSAALGCVYGAMAALEKARRGVAKETTKKRRASPS